MCSYKVSRMCDGYFKGFCYIVVKKAYSDVFSGFQVDPGKHIQKDSDFLRTLPEWFIFLYPMRGEYVSIGTKKKREYCMKVF
jgi:hypothetical protein